MNQRLREFRQRRLRANARIAAEQNLQVNRFFSLDTQAYQDGALPALTKELAGLAASLVLRCDDCVTYHIIRCKELGATDAQVWEVLNVGLVVGGSIVIPHLRRAAEMLDDVNAEAAKPAAERAEPPDAAPPG